MCSHNSSIIIGDLKVCSKCGICVTPNGAIFYDKGIININVPNKRRKCVTKRNKGIVLIGKE